jgi:16S rRNA processing protein RimM
VDVARPTVPDGLLDVGRIGRAHGIKGDVRVELTTDRRERVAVGSRLHAGGRWLSVERSRPAGTSFVVGFAEVPDRTAAEALAGLRLYAEPIEDPDALWVHQLIGARVVELDGTDRGECVAVLDNPAADLLELETGALVPVTFVVSASDGVVTIDPPDGLFD